MTDKTDIPAFPTGTTPGRYSQEGMSLRDWFAGQALTGICASATLYDEATARRMDASELACKAAYKVADLMLEARQK